MRKILGLGESLTVRGSCVSRLLAFSYLSIFLSTRMEQIDPHETKTPEILSS
jgi:hypothetical protein